MSDVTRGRFPSGRPPAWCGTFSGMAWQFNLNNYRPNGGSAPEAGADLYAFIQWLCSTTSFEVVGSSDGRSDFELEGQTGGAGTGAGGSYDVLATVTGTRGTWATNTDGDWSNINAWLMWRQSGTTRCWGLQRYTSGTADGQRLWKLIYYPDGFNTDSVLTALPTAADLIYWMGSASGWDYAGHRVNTAHDSVWHGGYDPSTTEGVSPWYWMTFDRGDTQNEHGILIFDAVQQKVATDGDPAVCLYTHTDPFVANLRCRAYYDFGGPNQDIVDFYPGSTTGFPGNIPIQADGVHRTFPATLVLTSRGLWKGVCKSLRINGSASLNYPDIIGLAGNAKVAVGHFNLPWLQGVLPEG